MSVNVGLAPCRQGAMVAALLFSRKLFSRKLFSRKLFSRDMLSEKTGRSAATGGGWRHALSFRFLRWSSKQLERRQAVRSRERKRGAPDLSLSFSLSLSSTEMKAGSCGGIRLGKISPPGLRLWLLLRQISLSIDTEAGLVGKFASGQHLLPASRLHLAPCGRAHGARCYLVPRRQGWASRLK